MARAPSDLADFLVAARTNDPRVVQALGERLPEARFHLPLAALEGIRNRPETALELGVELPVHWLRLDNGEKAVPLFTSLESCRRCAERLGWETDAKAIKSLAVPGDVALGYLVQALGTPGVERAVFDPLSASELHLARTEVESVAASRPLRALWFYSRDGRMKRLVRIEGASLLHAIVSKADRILDSLGGTLPSPTVASHPFPETARILEQLESHGQLGALASAIFRVVSVEEAGPLEVTVTRSEAVVSVEASPAPSPELLARLRDAAAKALEDDDEAGDLRHTFRVDGASIVSTSTSALPSPSASRSEPTAPPPGTERPPRLSYIPLEPEEREE